MQVRALLGTPVHSSRTNRQSNAVASGSERSARRARSERGPLWRRATNGNLQPCWGRQSTAAKHKNITAGGVAHTALCPDCRSCMPHQLFAQQILWEACFLTESNAQS